MFSVPFGDLRKILRDEKLDGFEAKIPIQIVVNGTPKYVIEKIDNVVALSDFHPGMRQKIMALVNIARLGRPVVKINTDEFKVELPTS